MNFWVYENYSTKKTTVHKETCSHCNYGEGLIAGYQEESGTWHGPFSSCEYAKQYANFLEDRELHFCKICKPEGDDASIVDFSAPAAAVAPTAVAPAWENEGIPSGVSAQQQTEIEAAREAFARETEGEPSQADTPKKKGGWVKWLLLALLLVLLVVLVVFFVQSCNSAPTESRITPIENKTPSAAQMTIDDLDFEAIKSQFPEAKLVNGKIQLPEMTFAEFQKKFPKITQAQLKSKFPEIEFLAPTLTFDQIKAKFPNATYEGGKLVIPGITFADFQAKFPEFPDLDSLKAIFPDVSFEGPTVTFDEIKAKFPEATYEGGLLTIPGTTFEAFQVQFPQFVDLASLRTVFPNVTFEAPAATSAPVVTPTPVTPVTPEPTPPVVTDSVAGEYKTTANLNVRPSASTDQSPLVKIPRGTTVTVTGAAEPGSKWYRVSYNGVEGYVDSDWLSRL